MSIDSQKLYDFLRTTSTFRTKWTDDKGKEKESIFYTTLECREAIIKAIIALEE